jgi:hypothetical protein
MGDLNAVAWSDTAQVAVVSFKREARVGSGNFPMVATIRLDRDPGRATEPTCQTVEQGGKASD